MAQEECHVDADGQVEENACGLCARCEGKDTLCPVHYDMNTAAIVRDIVVRKSKETLKHVLHIGYT